MDAKLFIMDEPSTVLTRYEIDILFGLMRRLKKQGTTIFFISHKLKEVKAKCDRVIVLRDGEVVCAETVENISVLEMARAHSGTRDEPVFPE